MEPHTRNLIILIIVAFLLSVAVGYFVPPASAEGNLTDEYEQGSGGGDGPPLGWTPEPTPVPIPKRVDQGGYVYIGEYYDIAGVTGWANDDGEYYLAWCNGGYGCYEGDASYLLHLPGKYKSGTVASQYRFYIDPEIFGTRLGVWEQWDGDYERAGNTVAFRVAPTRPPTEIEVEPTPEPTPTPEIPLVEPRKISDILIAHGDSFNFTTEDLAKLWVFGTLDGLYGVDPMLTKDQINDLDTGSYALLVQHPGKNTIYEASYSLSDGTLVSPWRNVPTVDVSANTPPMVMDKLVDLLGKGDDTYEIYKLEIQNPSIEITSIDETYSGGISVLDVRGYTNVAPGSILNFTLDESKATTEQSLKDHTFIAEAQGEYNGYSRFFQVYIPLTWQDMTVEGHTIIGRTPHGGQVNSDFWVSILPEDSYRPNTTLKYILDRNPYLATPTPEVIREVVTQKVVETIYIPVTPSDEQVYAQQKAAADATAKEYTTKAAIAGVLIIGGILGLIYAISVIRRARQ